jgi:N-carbamoylputrescine amidase
MTARPLKVGLVQMAMGEEPAANLAKAIDGVRDAAKRGAQLVVLPELFRSRYFCQSEDAAQFSLAEAIPGPSTDELGKLAAELKITLVASLFEKRAAGLYHNTAAVIDAERGYLGKYRKMHIPDDPRYYEKYYFTPGDLGFKVFAAKPAQLGVLVCWDQWYPEAARLTAMQGAEILIYPTAIGWHPEEKAEYGERQHGAWETVQRGHAVANGCFVVAVNRTGFEPDPRGSGGIEFWGQSFIGHRRPHPRARAGRPRGRHRRGDRPRRDRRGPRRLAVLSRSAYRRLFQHYPAVRQRVTGKVVASAQP